MAEPRVFLKENRGRIEENYLEQAKNLPRVFAPVDEKLQKCTEEVALACKYLSLIHISLSSLPDPGSELRKEVLLYMDVSGLHTVLSSELSLRSYPDT